MPKADPMNQGTSNHNVKVTLFVFALVPLLIALDQWSKLWTIAHFSLYESYELTSFFNWVYVRNYGAAFSFLSDQGGWQKYFFMTIAFVVSIVLSIWIVRLKGQKRLLALSLSLVIAGAIGNVIDRIIHGFVIDFLDFHLAGYHWPAFNVADICIVIGAGLMILENLLYPETSKEK